MTDGVIIGNGTSRLAKGSFPATYAEFVALAASSGVPMDVIFNAAGWQQQPTFLNKANLLPDDVAEQLEIPTDSVVKDAFIALANANQKLQAYIESVEACMNRKIPTTFQKLITGRLI